MQAEINGEMNASSPVYKLYAVTVGLDRADNEEERNRFDLLLRGLSNWK